MKKIIIVALTVAFAVAACGSKKNTTNNVNKGSGTMPVDMGSGSGTMPAGSGEPAPAGG